MPIAGNDTINNVQMMHNVHQFFTTFVNQRTHPKINTTAVHTVVAFVNNSYLSNAIIKVDYVYLRT